jgi:uncharacterized membrane protein YqjE
MPEKEGSTGSERSTGFLDTCKSVFVAITSALHTRLELFVTELEEERERLKQALLLTLLLFFGLSFGFILLNIFVVALFWEKGWRLALGGLAALYLGVGVVAAVMLRKKILTRPGLFPSTLAELEKDRDRLKASSRE